MEDTALTHIQILSNRLLRLIALVVKIAKLSFLRYLGYMGVLSKNTKISLEVGHQGNATKIKICIFLLIKTEKISPLLLNNVLLCISTPPTQLFSVAVT